MLPCLTSEEEEGLDCEEREDTSIEDPKEIITLAFVRENTGAQKGLQNAQPQGKKKKKKKRLGLKDREWVSWGAAQQYGLREGGENEDWTLYWTDYSVSLERVMEMKSYQPFVIDGFKFDLRIYVLLTSCDPLRIFVHKEGLARFATMSYSQPCPDNLDDICMHLTNYSINKHSSNFIQDAHSGSKRPPPADTALGSPGSWAFIGTGPGALSSLEVSGFQYTVTLDDLRLTVLPHGLWLPSRKLSTFNLYMETHGYNMAQVWRDMEDVIIKTIISAHPIIKHNYHTCFPNHTLNSACFEILGFDILLDHKLKPWLLEVNHSPSFSTDSWLDKEVKDSLLYDTLVLIDLGNCDKKKVLEEERQRGRFLQQCPSREIRIMEARGFQAVRLQKTEKYEKENCGGFRLIYPNLNLEKYEKFFQDNNSLFQNTIASRAREMYARQLIQELRLKQEKISFQMKEKKAEMQGESAGEQARGKRERSWQQTLREKHKAAPHVSRQYFHPLTLVSCTPDLLLSVADIKKNERDSSLNQEAPKEDGAAPSRPTSPRPSCSVPDLRNSNPSSSELELSKAASTVQGARSVPAVNVLTGAVNEMKKQQQMSELFKADLRRDFTLLPAHSSPKLVPSHQSQNASLPGECCPSSRSSGEKRRLDVSSLLLFQSPPSRGVTLSDLLVVASPARLDPRPSRSHLGMMKDLCVQDQDMCGHCLISDQKGSERN
ncbi:Tubulin polyglutamylase TTLL6 [Tupaia chinensis]|uniref:Tubulin polyglutamylase TTLL6 n=1 Tax=Tupaia chinensis TaxID=246437 RepID=L8Y5M8_TUPCH|nr:Tubulin polyglutamylase TTLL6 [Tupaia chinensis]